MESTHHETKEGPVEMSSGHGSQPLVLSSSKFGQGARERREDFLGRPVVRRRERGLAVHSSGEEEGRDEVVGERTSPVDFSVGRHGWDWRRGWGVELEGGERERKAGREIGGESFRLVDKEKQIFVRDNLRFF